MLRRFLGTSHSPNVAVVGSGPAACYCASTLLNHWKNCKIDVFEKLPVPYGLVRFGVAPDHPEVKNPINRWDKLFTEAESQGRYSFFGNVNVGKDLHLQELIDAYDLLVVAFGAELEKPLQIPGANSENYFSARTFVNWYNGLPGFEHLAPNFDCENAVIIGHGNVAFDVARLLLMPINMLSNTDVADHALDALAKSRIRHIDIVGRRGPLQVQFTIKELREMINLDGSVPKWLRSDFDCIEPVLNGLERPRKRLSQLMLETAKKPPNKIPVDSNKTWTLRFKLTPKNIRSNADNRVCGIELAVNKLEEVSDVSKLDLTRAIETEERETLDCGILFSSIGYRSVRIDPALPFDEARHVVPVDSNNRIVGLRNAYGLGWCSRGPVGVLTTTQIDGVNTARQIMADVNSGQVNISGKKSGSDAIISLLKQRNVAHVTWAQWHKIDSLEQQRGAASGRPKRKIVNLEELLRVAHSHSGSK